MLVTSYGHSCLLIEEGGARILIDPGVYSKGHDTLANLHAILITHEHPDHCDVTALRALLAQSTECSIYTNAGVGRLLDEAGITWKRCADGDILQVMDVEVSVHGTLHAEIYQGVGPFDNTGFLVGSCLFHPGDAVDVIPPKRVSVLALPVVAPWMRSAMAIDYAKRLKPDVVFPIHDGFLAFGGPFHALAERCLREAGIAWRPLQHGAPVEF